MTPAAYSFRPSLERGERAEEWLDGYFARRFVVTNPQRQRDGIDRLFTPRDGRAPFTVEYKTDWTAVRTHNVFVETVSVDREGIPGWAITSLADRLVYYLPEPESLIYVIGFEQLRAALPGWWARYETRHIPNHGVRGDYHTVGLLVPQDEFERVAEAVLDATEELRP